MGTAFDLLTGLPVVHKRPAETITVPFDFGLKLNGDALTGTPEVLADNQNLVDGSVELSLDTPFIAEDRYVVVQVSSGSNYEDYILTASCADTQGNEYQVQGTIKVWSLL
jgi:hypothetical protein